MRVAGSGTEVWSGQQLVMCSQPSKPGPSGRFDAAIAISPDCHTVLVMGGVQGHMIGGMLSNDIWAFDVDAETWREIHCSEECRWDPRRCSSALIAGEDLLLIGGIAGNSQVRREIWAAKVTGPSWYPQDWELRASLTPWNSVELVMQMPEKTGCPLRLLAFTTARQLFASADLGCTWESVSSSLPFGGNSSPLSVAVNLQSLSGKCCLAVITSSWQSWISDDEGQTWIKQASNPAIQGSLDGCGLKQQLIGFAYGDGGGAGLFSRSRDLPKMSLWSLMESQYGNGMGFDLTWTQITPLISLFPHCTSVNNLIAIAQSPCGKRTVAVEHNLITEFTIWRAGHLAASKHRKMLLRLGMSQQSIDPGLWENLIVGALLPEQDVVWEKKDIRHLQSVIVDNVAAGQDVDDPYDWHY